MLWQVGFTCWMEQACSEKCMQGNVFIESSDVSLLLGVLLDHA